MTWAHSLRHAMSRRGRRMTLAHRSGAVQALLAFTLTASGLPAAAPGTPEPRWRAPLDGPLRVVRSFRPPALPWLAGHRGVDLAGEPGARVRAAGAGRIGHAGEVAGRGVVTIRHEGGLRTTYLAVRPLVEPGAVVRPGDVIGLLEPLPGHCPAGCLHWGLLRGDRYLDPLLLLGHARVRLLPLWQVPFGSPGPPPAPAPGLRRPAAFTGWPRAAAASRVRSVRRSRPRRGRRGS